jgi:UDP-2,4-diacetamido-2,4,6-trideoxy-beta-L-altropyranose hydrolase
MLPNDIEITVVLGFTSPWISSVLHQAKLMPWKTHVMIGVNNMADLMAESDIAIGGAGSTSWERCCLGLPSITITLADNQFFISDVLLKAGASLSLDADQIGDKLPLKIPLIVNKMLEMSHTASNLVDGLGVGRVVDKLLRFQ